MKKYLFLLLVSLILLGCVPAEKQCAVDTDCVSATCCHAKEAVNKQYAPDCTGKACTAECREGTTDCGQGQIKCVSSQCKVVLKS